MKNKILAVVLLIVMVIPTIIAIANYATTQGGAADTHNTVSIELTDINENVYTFTRTDGKSEEIDFYLKMISSAESIGQLPTTVELRDFYKVNVNTTVNTYGYKFYFSTSEEDCYFVDNDGASFKITADVAKQFLSTPYSASLYENGTAPAFTVTGNRVYPDSANWYFKNNASEFAAQDVTCIVHNEVEELTLHGGLAMNFATEPDKFNVTVKNISDGKVLFDDVYSNISNLIITESMNVSVDIAANWFEDAERTYYGEQNFSFTATIGAPAQFYAGTTDIQAGEFISVTGVGVDNKDEITFSSEPAINYTPVFFEDGEYIRTLIPFNWDLEPGSYALNFSYGGSSQLITINVGYRDNPFGTRTVSIDDAIIASNGSEDARAKAEETFSPIAKSTEQAATRYFDDSDFLTGVGGATVVGGYGHEFTVSRTEMTFRHTGVDYALDAGADITAVQNGVVLYAGYLDYSGYTVVIEHGYGLKSWYCHMGETSVNVGDKVNKGDKVGTAGSTGFTSTTGAHIGLTIFDTPVCQYALWSDGVRKGIPLYNK